MQDKSVSWHVALKHRNIKAMHDEALRDAPMARKRGSATRQDHPFSQRGTG
jgi:hypothetical protein